MGDQLVVSCGYGDRKLIISSRKGVTRHEVALPFQSSCFATSAITVAIGGPGDGDEGGHGDGVRATTCAYVRAFLHFLSA